MKNKKKITKAKVLLLYLAIWLFSIAAFWISMSTGEDGGIAYSLLFLWGLIPITTFVISFLIGRNNLWGNFKWLTSIGFGIMYMMSEYATFSMANNLAFHNINEPSYLMAIAGAVISLIGMAIGYFGGDNWT